MTVTRADLFLPEEHRVLSAWLGVEPLADLPDSLSLDMSFNALGFEQEPTVHTQGDAAVASILLERVQDQLPQWAFVREGNVTLSRILHERRAIRAVELTPRRLLLVNWATSGPGFEWPEVYFMTYVPLYDVHVVTGSFDGDDCWGFTDIALGHFPAGGDLRHGSERIIRDEWAQLRSENDQPQWEYCEKGFIDSERALELADEIWADVEEGEEETETFITAS
jgi:hypothetical protein